MNGSTSRVLGVLALLLASLLPLPALAQSTSTFVGAWGDTWMGPGEGWPVRVEITKGATDADPRTMTVTFYPGAWHQYVCSTEVLPASDPLAVAASVQLNGTRSGSGVGAVWTWVVDATNHGPFVAGTTLTSTTQADGSGLLDGSQASPCILDITSGTIPNVDTAAAGDMISILFDFTYIDYSQPGNPSYTSHHFLRATYGALPVTLQKFTIE